MIIRSQDKERITDDLKLYIYEGEGQAAYYIRTSTHNPIGKYSTKEKAIIVLNMICQNYQDCKMCESGRLQIARVVFVFQMPQDSEV